MSAGQNIRRKKFMDGRYTPEELHQKYAFPPNQKCMCGSRPLVRAIVMMELKEAIKMSPEIEVAQFTHPSLFMQSVVAIHPSGPNSMPVPYFRVSVTYACKRCRPEMEKALAKMPSHCIVEIGEAPKNEKIITSG